MQPKSPNQILHEVTRRTQHTVQILNYTLCSAFGFIIPSYASQFRSRTSKNRMTAFNPTKQTIYSMSIPTFNHEQLFSADGARKRVTFGPVHTNEVHETLHRLDFSRDEKRAYWFTARDRQECRDKINDILQKMEKDGKKLSSQTCTRGLEAHTTAGAKIRRRFQQGALQAVLSEQDRQRIVMGDSSPANEYSIAIAYKEFASRCQRDAYSRGIMDQIECETKRIFPKIGSNYPTWNSVQTVNKERNRYIFSPLYRSRKVVRRFLQPHTTYGSASTPSPPKRRQVVKSP